MLGLLGEVVDQAAAVEWGTPEDLAEMYDAEYARLGVFGPDGS